MTDSANSNDDTILIETHIEASPATVWQALTEGIGDWWPGAAFGGGEEGKRTFHLEARVGGRMWEEWENGGGLLWGQVVTVEPEKKLQATGHTFAEWGGPSVMFATWVLEESDGGCTLRFSEDAVGAKPEGYYEEKHKGWTFLWQALRAHLEGTPAPAWED